MPLFAPRYNTERVSPSLVRIITETLPFMAFEEAQAFYADFVPKLNQEELALLGCNDRFFLLTGLLNRPDAIHPWLYDRCREVEARPDGYIDLWARGHYKSTIITFAGTIQEVLRDPEITIGIFANTKDISRPFLQQIKEECEMNEVLKSIYPDVLWQNPRREAPSWSVAGGLIFKRKSNPKECTIEAHGLIDGMPTGRHFKLLDYDDVINEKNVGNPEQIKKSTERFELSDNLGVGEKTRKWVVGTRYSFADSYGHMIEHGIAIPRLYPATDNGRLDGHPVFLSPEGWAERKRAQRSTISAQMLQNPIAGQENIFRTQWLRPYHVRPVYMTVYILGDPSAGRHKSSDRTAFAVIGIDAEGNKYFLDGFCHRMKLSDRWRNLKMLHKKWSEMNGVVQVSVGYERYGMQADLEHFDAEMVKENKGFGITELNWANNLSSQSKPSRVGRLEPDFEHGDFFMPAKVYHPSVGVATWSVVEKEDKIIYEPYNGPSAQERQCRARGELWRLFDPIRRVDQDGNVYDVTRVFFEEFQFFPFSPRDDLIDAVSRIYDMNPVAPKMKEEVNLPNHPDY